MILLLSAFHLSFDSLFIHLCVDYLFNDRSFESASAFDRCVVLICADAYTIPRHRRFACAAAADAVAVVVCAMLMMIQDNIVRHNFKAFS